MLRISNKINVNYDDLYTYSIPVASYNYSNYVLKLQGIECSINFDLYYIHVPM